ncbi:MAG: 2-hydroxyglutaryl-CoA dehydratase [Myxococcales bacterium]|nr:2-hydroxyglutaryl-CoA dehydratase [Myxococcales bacterium]
MLESTIDIDSELARFEAEERARLGLATETGHWKDSMTTPQFTAGQRPKTTLLLGGLTIAHDFIVEGALKGLGYQVRALDCPDQDSLRAGKEYGNRGQCNPTHFTVGNLVKELCRLRDEEGLSAEEVVDGYAFLTAGACGPCRFGMYVTEYRKALREAGFDGFRVLLFQHAGSLDQTAGEEMGLELNASFFIALAKALFSGDVINMMAYRLRPYEVEPGATDRAVEEVKQILYDALAEGRSVVGALLRARRVFAAVKVDPTRPKPRVSVLGEFWAMTTEGDGNYHLQRFLEEEGAQVEIQIIANLVLYNLWEVRHDTKTRAMLRGADGGPFGLEDSDAGLILAGVWLGDLAVRGIVQTFAHLIGLYGHKLPDMEEVAQVGHSHYNVELRGGEGHMEVAKLILNVIHQKAHMTISVKPFGCMPSSGVSDGVQSAVTELYPEAIFCPVETSGDGAVSFHSRVQMYLFKARQRALEEFEAALTREGVTVEQVRDFIAGSRYSRPFFKPPHRAAGAAADLVHHVGPLIGKGPLERARIHLGRGLERGQQSLKTAKKHGRALGEVAPYLPSLLRAAVNGGLDAVPPLRKAFDSVVENLIKQQEAPVSIERAGRTLPVIDDQPVAAE